MGRRLGATLLGLVAGTATFAVLLLVGLVVYQRLWGNSTPILTLMLVFFGAVGLYGGWLIGVVVFSAALGRRDGEESQT
jgi:hypothetical protein